MECGKLTAKLRDAVPVCFMDGGMEVKRFKNIEIPDEIKKLPFDCFKFDVPAKGAITFKIYFAPGILPKEWPQARERKARIPKQVEKITTVKIATTQTVAVEEAAASSLDIEDMMEIDYDVIGERRKALIAAIGEYLDIDPVYQNAPTFAYAIGEYSVNRVGILTGPTNPTLIEYLTSKGFAKV